MSTWIQIVLTKENFSIFQKMSKSKHLHVHILDLILSPNNSSFISNVVKMVKCQLDLSKS